MAGAHARTTVGNGLFGIVDRVDETGSTNADLLRAAAEGAPEGSVLVADLQTSGRGRRDRTWTAPAGSSLLVSVLLRPRFALERVPLLGLAMGVAAVDACAAVAGVDLRLKWPNDVVAVDPLGDGRDRKVAGILGESALGGGPGGDGAGERGEGPEVAVVVGMGLNVSWPDELPAELASTATSLRHLCGREIDRDVLLDEVLRGLEPLYRGFDTRDGATVLLDRYRARSATLGREVRVELAEGELLGRATAVDDEGHLLVEDDDGRRTVVSVGDVVHLRPR